MMTNGRNKDLKPISRWKSITYALSGIVQLFVSEPNAKLHSAATVAVIVLGIARHIAAWQWGLLLLAIGMVWITEGLNTCVEKLCDLWVGDKWHPEIKVIKDIAAGAVLIAAIVSVSVGVLVFFL